ncbi:MAG: hypothetical protein H7328_03950 [Bdellovibrio sp.]|nr:hypothetical protein [Bdellovibrio sp.]
MSGIKFLSSLIILSFSLPSLALPGSGKYFDRAIFVIFENTNYAAAIKQPFFKKLADKGAHFSNFSSTTHPSQGNYIALTSGSLNGVSGDGSININSKNIVDLLEAKSLTWKVYAEDYPGNCFTGSSKANYARKHNPFISYINIQKNPARCANIVNASQFEVDAKNGNLPNYVFYIPNLKSDGHDTGVAFADKWYDKTFSSYLNDAKFMASTVLISTFDESGSGSKNQIYTSIIGPAVKPAVISMALDIFSLLNLIEDNWNLGNLGKSDVSAIPIPKIWN